jgi:hypothetical protein
MIAGFTRHPVWWSVVATVVSLLAAAGAVVLADFGAPWWVFALLLAWLLTIGLPPTLAVLLTASLWGRIPGLYGMGGFVVCVAALSFVAQALCFAGAARLVSKVRSAEPRECGVRNAECGMRNAHHDRLERG